MGDKVKEQGKSLLRLMETSIVGKPHLVQEYR